nr:hypothetical protein CFP56_11803 [Quercus suber]
MLSEPCSARMTFQNFTDQNGVLWGRDDALDAADTACSVYIARPPGPTDLAAGIDPDGPAPASSSGYCRNNTVQYSTVTPPYRTVVRGTQARPTRPHLAPKTAPRSRVLHLCPTTEEVVLRGFTTPWKAPCLVDFCHLQCPSTMSIHELAPNIDKHCAVVAHRVSPNQSTP